jgi:hypothetical protein
VPLHQELRGTNDFQRVPDGTRATVIEVAQDGRSLCVESALHERVEKAATTAGVEIAAWLRSMVRRITIEDFPLSC